MRQIPLFIFLMISIAACDSSSSGSALSTGSTVSLSTTEQSALKSAGADMRLIGSGSWGTAYVAVLTSAQIAAELERSMLGASASTVSGSNKSFTASLNSCGSSGNSVTGTSSGTITRETGVAGTYNVSTSYTATLAGCTRYDGSGTGTLTGTTSSNWTVSSSSKFSGTHSFTISGTLQVTVGTTVTSFTYNSLSATFTASDETVSDSWSGQTDKLLANSTCSGTVTIAGATTRDVTCQDFLKTGIDLLAGTSYP